MQPDAKQLTLSAKWLKYGDISIVDLIYSFENGIDAIYILHAEPKESNYSMFQTI
jgi:hypothetical protein